MSYSSQPLSSETQSTGGSSEVQASGSIPQPEKRSPITEWPAWLLRRADQAAVAGLVLFGLLGTVGWWLSQGGLQGRLVELEKAQPRQASYLVDINSADWPELVQLPGIGEVLARRIVEERASRGPFRDLDDLRERVRGVGPATLERIRPFVRPLPPTRNLADK